MEQLLHIIFENLFLVFGIVFVIYFICYIIYLHLDNRKRGLYFEDPPEDTIIFKDSFGSGRTYQGGASNCLKLMLTDSNFFVRPVFPFILFGGKLDLIHAIDLTKISKVEPYKKRFLEGLSITFRDKADIKKEIVIFSIRRNELKKLLPSPVKELNESPISHSRDVQE